MTRWLNDDEQRAWRAWIEASNLLNHRLSADLQRQHDITLADYEILVQLSEHPERRMRMSELADATLSSRSRLSHQVDRLVKRGFVERQECELDKRGSFAALTDHGWKAIVTAAPDHVTSVREHLVDVLGPQDFAALGAACDRITSNLQGNED
ncbi:MarR family transcriptional regulator [bacterium]|jgi:DNA-binding MarR family transcriptional regulator|nr:MarR family transcriptional regulator [bacterium]